MLNLIIKKIKKSNKESSSIYDYPVVIVDDDKDLEKTQYQYLKNDLFNNYSNLAYLNKKHTYVKPVNPTNSQNKISNFIKFTKKHLVLFIFGTILCIFSFIVLIFLIVTCSLKNCLLITKFYDENKQAVRLSFKNLAKTYTQLAGNFEYGGIRVWDTQNGKLIYENLNITNSFDIDRVTISLGTGHLATGYSNGLIYILDLKKNFVKYVFKCSYFHFGQDVEQLINLNNGFLASVCKDFTIKIWDTNSGDLKYTFDLYDNGRTIKIGKIVAIYTSLIVVCVNNIIFIWDTDKGSLKITLKASDNGHKEFVEDILYLGDGYLASCSYDEVKLWFYDEKFNEIRIKYSFNVNNTRFSKLMLLNSSYLGCSTTDGFIYLLDMNSFDIILVKNINDDSLNRENNLIELDGIYVAKGYMNGSINVWDVLNKNWELKFVLDWTIGGHDSQILQLVYLGDGVLASLCQDLNIKIWNIYKRKLLFDFFNHDDEFKIKNIITFMM